MSTKVSKQLSNLTPGQNVIVLVRSIDQNGKYSDWASYPYTIPVSPPGGGNIPAPNPSTDIKLSGGSIFATSSTNPFPPNIGHLDIVSGTTTGTGVVLNSTGLAGFNSGVKEFYIDASTGKAYFAGTVTAGTVTIGSNIQNIGSLSGKDGIYIDATNYWFSDGSFSATAKDIAGPISGKNPRLTPPNPVTSLSASWSGSTFYLSWSFNNSASDNDFAKDFIITFVVGTGDNAVTRTITVPISQKLYLLTSALNKSFFGLPAGTSSNPFTSISVVVEDTFGNKSTSVPLASIPTYVSSLTAPTSISLTPINNGYTVAYTTPTDASFYAIEIAESIVSGTSGFNTIYSGTLNPATILASNLNQRWVKARFIDDFGGATSYCNANTVTPNSAVTLNTNATNEVNSASAAFVSGGHGDDIQVSTILYSKSSITATGNGTLMTYTCGSDHGLVSGDQVTISGMSIAGYNVTGAITVPSGSTTTFTLPGTATGSGTSGVVQYAGVTYIVKLISTLNPSNISYFYFSPDSSGSTSQTFTITKSDIFNHFGDYYSSFSGLLISVNPSGIRSNGKTIDTFSRSSSLTGIVPIATVTAITNGFTATFNYSGTNATYGEVYIKYTSGNWTSNPSDFFTFTRLSGGTSGTNTVTVNNVKGDDGNTSTSLIEGYPISGLGIPDNTYIQSISGTAPNFTLTLNNNFTQNASGDYQAQSLVYSGRSPATIPSSLYQNTYVLFKYYDDYHNNSSVSSEYTVLPIDPAAVNLNAPTPPTISYSSNTYKSITVSINTIDVSTKSYYLRYKKTTDTNYTTISIPTIEAFLSGTSSTSYTIIGLEPSTTYVIGASANNQYNNISSYSNLSSNPSTSSQTVNVVTSVITNKIAYGIHASWIAPASQPTTVSKYKIELYNSSGTLISTNYTAATTYDFINLTAGTAYYIKVYSQDIYGGLSSSVQSSPNITISSYTTDGVVPSNSPDPIAVSLYGAITVKWSPVTNVDPVTYEVHLSTSSGFTPSSSTKFLETPGTSSVITTLPGSSTPLTYGTTYYIKVVAKDGDGYATTPGLQTSAIPIKLQTLDIANSAITATQIASQTITAANLANNTITAGQILANTITSNEILANTITSGQIQANTITAAEIASSTITATQIAANAITATQIDADAVTSSKLNANAIQAKTFNIGGTSGTYNIKIDGTGSGTGATPYKIYSGIGTWKGSTTGFYLDSIGQFSIFDKLNFDPSTSKLTVNGVIQATEGYFSGALSVNGSGGSMKLGPAADGGTNAGLYISSGNYWYSNGIFAVGNALTWNGTALNVAGAVNASSLAVTGNSLLAGSLVAATSYPISNAVGNGTTIAYTTSGSALVAGQTVTIVGINPSTYNITGTVLSSPTPTATSFSITNSATGTYISGGTVMVTGGTTNAARVLINNQGLFSYDANGNNTTSIVGNASNGANTFITTKAQIADWNISSNKIESTLITGITKYTGLSASNTSYALWAGAGASGNTGNDAPFSVTPLGAVSASNIAITGGPSGGNVLSVGGLFTVSSLGAMTATSATITGNITAQTGNFTGNVGITSPGSLYSGTKLTQTITAVSIPSTNTARYVLSASHTLTTNSTVYISGVSGATTGSFNGTYKVSAINVVANSFDVTITGIAGTAVISTTAPIAQIIDVTSGYILNTSGIVFNNSTTRGITTIDATTGLLTTKNADIGQWIIDSTSITKTSNSGTIKLDTSTTTPRISAYTTGYSAGLSSPAASTDVVFWAGAGTAASTTGNNFYVTAAGNAYIGGTATIAGTVTIGGSAASNLITGTQVNTNVTSISGAVITTGTINLNNVSINNASTGARVSLDSTGLKAYSTAGGVTPTVAINSDGSASFKGTITGSTITGSTFTTPNYGSSVSGQGGITIYTGVPGLESIFFSSGTGSGYSTAALTFTSGAFAISGPAISYLGSGGKIQQVQIPSGGLMAISSNGNQLTLDAWTGNAPTYAIAGPTAALSYSSASTTRGLRNMSAVPSAAAPASGTSASGSIYYEGDVILVY